MRTCSPLAVLYNDKSCLENHHSAAAFKLMTEDEQMLQFKVGWPCSWKLPAQPACSVWRQNLPESPWPQIRASAVVCAATGSSYQEPWTGLSGFLCAEPWQDAQSSAINGAAP